jgi:hypothetical protein
LVAAFERIFGATIFFGTDSMNAKARVVHSIVRAVPRACCRAGSRPAAAPQPR